MKQIIVGILLVFGAYLMWFSYPFRGITIGIPIVIGIGGLILIAKSLIAILREYKKIINQSPLPTLTKTKIAVWWIIALWIILPLVLGIVYIFLPSSSSYDYSSFFSRRGISEFFWDYQLALIPSCFPQSYINSPAIIIAFFIQIIFSLLLIIFSLFVLLRRKWAWGGSVILLLVICIGLMGLIVRIIIGDWTDFLYKVVSWLIFYPPPLVFLLLDRKNFWKIAT